MAWNPELYHKFKKERFEPFKDLMSLIVVREGLRVLDLGCGTGELTEMVLDMLPQSEVLGIDSSKEMLEKTSIKKRPGLNFELCPIEKVSGGWDLIFSNAAIQWVSNHDQLIPVRNVRARWHHCRRRATPVTACWIRGEFHCSSLHRPIMYPEPRPCDQRARSDRHLV